MRHTALVGATSGGGAGRPVAMDVSSIASVTDTASSPLAGDPPAADWATGETGWPVDEEGNQIEGWIDGQLNFVKGKGKGKENAGTAGGRGTGQRNALILRPQGKAHTAIREKATDKAKGKEREKGNDGRAVKWDIDPMSAKIPQEKEKGRDTGRTAGSESGRTECARSAG